MRAPLITISKFIGTISLGLLTVRPAGFQAPSVTPPATNRTQGLSYTLTTLTYPTLLYLPTAGNASAAQAALRTRARHAQRSLSAVALAALAFAFTFAPRRARHPYLLWSAAAVGLGLAGPRVERAARAVGAAHGWGGRMAAAPGVRVAGDALEVDESAVLVDGGGSSSGKSESGDEEVNGEVVRRGVERARAVEAVRTGIWGLGFAMLVVGIWGDGA